MTLGWRRLSKRRRRSTPGRGAATAGASRRLSVAKTSVAAQVWGPFSQRLTSCRASQRQTRSGLRRARRPQSCAAHSAAGAGGWVKSVTRSVRMGAEIWAVSYLTTCEDGASSSPQAVLQLAAAALHSAGALPSATRAHGEVGHARGRRGHAQAAVCQQRRRRNGAQRRGLACGM